MVTQYGNTCKITVKHICKQLDKVYRYLLCKFLHTLIVVSFPLYAL